MAKNKEFKELQKELDKTQDTKVIKIADILKDTKSKEEEDEKVDKEKLSIQTEEAAEILADLVVAK